MLLVVSSKQEKRKELETHSQTTENEREVLMKEFFGKITGFFDSLVGHFSFFGDLWNLKLITVDNQPITIGKIFLGVILFGVGWFACRKVSFLLEKRILSHLDIEESLVHTFRMVFFYIILFISVLFILRLLNVPITVFTLVGGALAIGVGFGSQNIVNNFISGIIIMIERPVRVGDLVELKTENLVGIVKNIGSRSTHIQSLDNTHYVVPNSFFLEKHVLNWTLSDNLVRSHVSVGVAYGSPTEKVKEILEEVLKEEPRVLSYPDPDVILSEFGDNSLTFNLYFWLRIKSLFELRILKSDLRFRIEKAFRDQGIMIAFPQRDVHLDTRSPLKVELTKSK